MNFSDYLAIDAEHWTALKVILDSPLAYAAAKKAPRVDTAAMAIGRAVHVAVLEPDEFPARYAVIGADFWNDPSLKRNTKEGKARFADWLAAHPEDADLDADAYKSRVFAESNPGKEVIPEDAYRRCLQIRDAVRLHPVARAYVADSGANEQTIRWTERVRFTRLDGTEGEMEIPCKGRIDRINDSPLALLDLKTTQTVDSRRFAAQVARLNYHGQVEFYRRGWRALTGCDVPCALLAVESEPPHDVAVVNVDEDSLHIARLDVDRALSTLARCIDSGRWPGRYDAPIPLELPRHLWPAEDASAAGLGLDFTDEEEHAT